MVNGVRIRWLLRKGLENFLRTCVQREKMATGLDNTNFNTIFGEDNKML